MARTRGAGHATMIPGLPADPQSADDGPGERRIPERFLIGLVQKIVETEQRRKMLRNLKRGAGEDALISGIARAPESEVVILPLADESPAGEKRPSLGVIASDTEPELRGRRSSSSPMPVAGEVGEVDA